MPTYYECQGTINRTTFSWTVVNNVNGARFISNVDSSEAVFVPAEGYYSSGELLNGDSRGSFWSSVPAQGRSANHVWFYSGGAGLTWGPSYHSMSVRGVLPP